MIEQRAVAVLACLQALDEPRERLGVIRLHLRERSSFAGSFWWCDSGWNASDTPIWLYVRMLTSFAIMNVVTRVTFA